VPQRELSVDRLALPIFPDLGRSAHSRSLAERYSIPALAPALLETALVSAR
jgi:hypothetical protein